MFLLAGNAITGSLQIADLIAFPGVYPVGRAWNPSITTIGGRRVMAITVSMDRDRVDTAEVRLLELGEDFQITKSFDPRLNDVLGTKYSEDMRVFVHGDRLYGICYAGSPFKDGSGLALVELNREMNVDRVRLLDAGQRCREYEKNWLPFSWGNDILCVYSITPHRILRLSSSIETMCETGSALEWSFGEARGGTPPIEVDGEYLSFFHSYTYRPGSEECWTNRVYHVGAYTFSNRPPFSITRATKTPLMTATLDNIPPFPATVFPCGAICENGTLWVSYGKHDRESRIAAIEVKELNRHLEPTAARQ